MTPSILVALVLLAAPAREVVWDGRSTIALKVPVARPGASLTTAVVFPEEALADVIAGWDKEALTLERAYGQLFLRLLRDDHRGHLDVVGQSGRLYRLYLEPAAQGEHDEAVHIRLSEDVAGERLREALALTPLGLIRAMRLGRVPQGVETEEATEELPPLHDDGTLRLKVERVYRAALLTGYVLVLENTGATPYEVNVQKLTLPRLMLVGVESLHVPPGETTRLYLVQHP
ncbi:MAG: type-F conjugative transfer system secretin TraK [Planctomycetes bacterium]|nr:type-F conjugative transfer system secretin TraK [Planctomycetota bacterium]